MNYMFQKTLTRDLIGLMNDLLNHFGLGISKLNYLDSIRSLKSKI
jgi:hypothetical protein